MGGDLVKLRTPFAPGATRAPRRLRALTIEYAIVMMLLVAAFVGLLLATSALVSENAADYREYTAQKRFMDDVAAVYIEQQGASGCLDPFTENDYDYVFSYSGSELVIREPGLGGRVLLRVVLESTDTDGNGTLVVSYIYGLA